MSVDQKVVVITGVTSGLGEALLDEFVRVGHYVFGCGRRKERIEKLNVKYGPNGAKVSVVDTTSVKDVKRWGKEVLASLGSKSIDILINNSGVNTKHIVPLWEIPEEECSKVLNTNVIGYINVLREFIPIMLSKKHGMIINVSSGQGRAPSDLLGPYSISKWAVESMSKSVALSLPESMGCCSWAPGIVKTEMNPSKRWPEANIWVKDAVPFLLSLGPKENGQSVHTKGYYPQEVMKNWIIKDGSFFDTRNTPSIFEALNREKSKL